MDLSIMGSIHNYTKTLELQNKVNQKKDKGALGSHEASRWNAAPAQPEEDDHNDKLKKIMRKVESGGKLTGDEKAYLRSKDPETYQELEAREQEARDYEAALRRCRTKEDVQRLKASRMGASLAKLKSVENNPHITMEKKLKICTGEKLKLEKFEESTRKFVEKGEYEALPTEAETARAAAEQHEAEEARRAPQPEKAEAKPAETKKPEEKPAEARPAAEKPKTPPEPERRPDFHQESPEAQKVRRAKAKAAYAAPKPEEAPAPSLDTKG